MSLSTVYKTRGVYKVFPVCGTGGAARGVVGDPTVPGGMRGKDRDGGGCPAAQGHGLSTLQGLSRTFVQQVGQIAVNTCEVTVGQIAVYTCEVTCFVDKVWLYYLYLCFNIMFLASEFELF